MIKFLPLLFLLFGVGLNAQPPQFGEVCSTEKTRQLVRFLTIDGMMAVPGQDWVAIIDSDGWTVARDTVIDLTGYQGCPGAPGYSLDVVGQSDFGITCPAQGAGTEYGLADNEIFRVVAWDASTGVFYTGDEVLTYTNTFAPFGPPPGGQCDTINYAGLSSLPVEFAYINARDLGGKIALRWGTATEQNSDYMVIERSRNFANFETVGRVDAAGTSEELVDYTFVDATPLTGENYYRIKQVDYDGAVTYSGIVLVKVAGSATALNNLTVYPNPASGGVSLTLDGEWSSETAEVTIISAVGRQLDQWRQYTGTTKQLDISDYPTGIYLVRASDGKRKTTRRLIVR